MSARSPEIEKLVESQDIAALSKLIAPLKDANIQTMFPGDILCVPRSANLGENLAGPLFYEITDISTFEGNLETGEFVKGFEISGIYLYRQWKGKPRIQRFMDFTYNRHDNGEYWILSWIVFPTSEARAHRKKPIANEEESHWLDIEPGLKLQ